MVGSAHGAPVADDVVSDADTNLSFLHRREQVRHPPYIPLFTLVTLYVSNTECVKLKGLSKFVLLVKLHLAISINQTTQMIMPPRSSAAIPRCVCVVSVF